MARGSGRRQRGRKVTWEGGRGTHGRHWHAFGHERKQGISADNDNDNNGVNCYELIYTLIFIIFSVLCLTIGIIVQIKYKEYSNFTGEDWVPPIILITTGVVGCIIGFVKCCCICCMEGRCSIICIIMMTIITFLQLGAGIAGYQKYGEIEGIFKPEFNKTMQQYNESKVYQNAWDVMQTNLNCCGINKADDWPTNNLPKSCCDGQKNCTKNEPYVHEDGCFYKLVDLLHSKALILGGVGIISALIQFFILIFTYMAKAK